MINLTDQRKDPNMSYRTIVKRMKGNKELLGSF